MSFSAYTLGLSKQKSSIGRQTVFQTPDRYNSAMKSTQQMNSVRKQNDRDKDNFGQNSFVGNAGTFEPHRKNKPVVNSHYCTPRKYQEQIQTYSPPSQRKLPRSVKKGIYHVDILAQSYNYITPLKGGKKVYDKRPQRDDKQRRNKSASKLNQYKYYLNSNQLKETLLQSGRDDVKVFNIHQTPLTEYQQSMNFKQIERVQCKTSRQYEHYFPAGSNGFYIR